MTWLSYITTLINNWQKQYFIHLFDSFCFSWMECRQATSCWCLVQTAYYSKNSPTSCTATFALLVEFWKHLICVYLYLSHFPCFKVNLADKHDWLWFTYNFLVHFIRLTFTIKKVPHHDQRDTRNSELISWSDGQWRISFHCCFLFSIASMWLLSVRLHSRRVAATWEAGRFLFFFRACGSNVVGLHESLLLLSTDESPECWRQSQDAQSLLSD